MTGDRRDDRRGEWVTVARACAILERSERTVRRMARDGRLPRRKDGPRLLVDVSGAQAAVPGGACGTPDLQGQVALLQAEVDKLQALVRQLTGERDYLRMALAEALRLARPAIDAPKKRRWRWPWQAED